MSFVKHDRSKWNANIDLKWSIIETTKLYLTAPRSFVLVML